MELEEVEHRVRPDIPDARKGANKRDLPSILQLPRVPSLMIESDRWRGSGNGRGVEPIPSANFLTEKNDPANKGLIIKGDLLHTGYITMNVTEPPFDSKLVCQAVNMAIAKERIVRIVNGRGVIANQPLPPAMPGYDPNYKGHPPRRATASGALSLVLRTDDRGAGHAPRLRKSFCLALIVP